MWIQLNYRIYYFLNHFLKMNNSVLDKKTQSHPFNRNCDLIAILYYFLIFILHFPCFFDLILHFYLTHLFHLVLIHQIFIFTCLPLFLSFHFMNPHQSLFQSGLAMPVLQTHIYYTRNQYGDYIQNISIIIKIQKKKIFQIKILKKSRNRTCKISKNIVFI